RLEALVRELSLEENVALLGFVKNPSAYMAHSAVFVLSSAWEGFGNVIVEAIAVKTPVVSTDCQSGPAEILDNGKYGSLVPVGDTKAMAEAILSVLSGNSKRVDSAWLDQFSQKSSRIERAYSQPSEQKPSTTQSQIVLGVVTTGCSACSVHGDFARASSRIALYVTGKPRVVAWSYYSHCHT
ncbi:MAG: glycosyltransferase, partial [Coleofasciculus sp. C3-bin4]|nr:glycosyltransferase [Coleofasciculus sp. C3-bin4]